MDSNFFDPLTVSLLRLNYGKPYRHITASLSSRHERVLLLIDPEIQISVGGFSQGASLTASLMTEIDLPIRRFVLFSPGSTKLSDEDLPSDRHPVVFLSHGRQDKPQSFSNAERLRDLIESKGGAVEWHPFDGGHTIPFEILSAARRFLYDRSPSNHQTNEQEK